YGRLRSVRKPGWVIVQTMLIVACCGSLDGHGGCLHDEQSVHVGIPIAERRLQCSAPDGLVQFVWKALGQRQLAWNPACAVGSPESVAGFFAMRNMSRLCRIKNVVC